MYDYDRARKFNREGPAYRQRVEGFLGFGPAQHGNNLSCGRFLAPSEPAPTAVPCEAELAAHGQQALLIKQSIYY